MSSMGAQCNHSLGGPIRNCMGECCSQLWDTWEEEHGWRV